MDKKAENQLLVENDISLKETHKSPKSFESNNKNAKTPNEEVSPVVNKTLSRKGDSPPSQIGKLMRSAGNSPVKSRISSISVDKSVPITPNTQKNIRSRSIDNDNNNITSPRISAPVKTTNSVANCDIKTPRQIPKLESSKTVKPVKPIGSSFSINNKGIHKKTSMIPIKQQKNFTKTEPFNLSHITKKSNAIRTKSRTCVDLKANADDTSSDVGKLRPSSSRLTTRNSGMGIVDLPGMQNHRIGEVPKYLKTSEKPATIVAESTAFTSKKRTFNNLKKKLCDCQTEFLQAYKLMQDAQVKLNKGSGKEANNNKTEVFDLVAVTTDDGKLLLVKDQSSDHLLKDDSKKIDVELGTNITEEIEHKLQNITEVGYKICKEFISSISKLNAENNSDLENCGDKETVGNTLNNQIGDMVSKMDQQIDIAFNEQQISLKELVKIIKPENSPISSEQQIDPQELIQNKKSLEIYKIKCNKLETTITELMKDNAIISDLQKELKEKQLAINNKEQETQRLRAMNKNLDEQKRSIEGKKEAIEKKLIAKEVELQKSGIELQNAQNRIKSCDDVMEEIKHEKEKVCGYICREQEVSKLYELERSKCEQLQQDLDEKDKQLKKAIIDFENHKKSTILGSGDRFNQEHQLLDEIKTIKLTLEATIKEKEAIEIQKNILENSVTLNNNDTYKMELCKCHEEMSHLQKANEFLRENLNKLEQTVNRKCGVINELEQKIANGAYLTNTSKEIQNELNILRETDAEKRREIEHLKCEVAKCHIEIKQQEETIYMHQRLLRIRSELINSLQEKEASNRCRMDDLYSEVTKKSTQINQSDLQMNHEISAKAEELQNLFSTLGTKQMELTRQEHIIKMLEENNDRNQRLRVKQEEKICRLENEISELKNIIKITNLKAKFT